ncbi:MAG TPA: DUF309 domain-containing protein [Thermodesulfobacteriota bacterium]|nr:DUF309 domain-containing protein [Thermodesulfobacteriota bacterium]
MKKRGKEEVEIRNILSEVLVFSLKSSDKCGLLYLIFRYCQSVDTKNRKKIRLRDLAKSNEDVGWLRFSREISNELSLLSTFDVDPEGYVQLKGRFQKYLPDVCSKVGKYWSFVSSLYSVGEEFNKGIEDDVKKGVLLFNEGFYFECHEFLEEVWKEMKGKEKTFLKGLIHAAVALYHLEYENLKGTVTYLRRSQSRLKEFAPTFLGVDVKTFIDQIEIYLRLLETSDSSDTQSIKSAVPKIRFIE